MICATILSGCNNTEVTSNDTEPVTTTSAVITTVAPTTKTTETTVAPTTESETTVAQIEAETEPQDTEAQTEAPKVETEKPETNKPSSNTNSGGNTTSSQKPAQNNNNNKPNDNTTQVVTDDTPIPHSQLCTDANMSKITSAVNTAFSNKGMILNSTLNKDNCGWFLTQTNLTAYSECSVNKFANDTITSFTNEVDAFLSMSGASYSDLTFYCYAEKQPNGEYNIYFCHE